MFVVCSYNYVIMPLHEPRIMIDGHTFVLTSPVFFSVGY